MSTIPDLKWKQSFSNNLSLYCLDIDTPLWQCLRVRLRSSSCLPQLAAKLPFFECSSFPKCAFCFTNLSTKSKVGELPIRIATVGAEGCRQRNCSESPTSTDTVERVKANAHGADRRSWHLGFPATHLSSLAIPSRSLFAERTVVYKKCTFNLPFLEVYADMVTGQ